MTGVSIADLRGDAPFSIRPEVAVRFKKRADCREDEVAPATAIAEQVAKALVGSVEVGEPRIAAQAASAIRSRLVPQWNMVHLQALIDFAWDHGIVVGHMAELPKGSKKFDGLAMYIGGRPVIILGSGRDSPAWLAFHLAHEIGHIFCGHVTADSGPLSDASLGLDGDDPQEKEANTFALQLLTGRQHVEANPVYGLTGERLVMQARDIGARESIDPGVVALLYGWSAERMPVAQRALALMNAATGAHDLFRTAVRARLKPDLHETALLLTRLVTES